MKRSTNGWVIFAKLAMAGALVGLLALPFNAEPQITESTPPIQTVDTSQPDKDADALRELSQINEVLNNALDNQIAANKDLAERLAAAEKKLELFVDPIEYETDTIPTYNLPVSTELQEYTYKTCIEYGIVDHYELVLALMWRESNFNPTSISSTNDYGLMQINKVNHAWLTKKLGITDFLDAEQNIEAGVYILSSLLHKYRDVNKALMAYQFGENGARRYWNRGIYKSPHSQSTLSKMELVLQDKYY